MLGSFSEKALHAYHTLAREGNPSPSFKIESYDFTRCVRPDGTAYGTKGKCRKGVEQAKDPDDLKTSSSVKPKGKVRNKPQNPSTAKDLSKNLPKELKGSVKELADAYEHVSSLKKQNLPSAENWRIEDADSKVYVARKKALEDADRLGLKDEFEKLDWAAFARSRSQTELQTELSKHVYDLAVLRDSPGKKEDLGALEKKTLVLVDHLESPTLKARFKYVVDESTGKVKVSKPGTLKGTIGIGENFLNSYSQGLKSTVSIIRKANLLEDRLRNFSKQIETEKEPGWIKKKMRLSRAIMKAAHHRGNAEARLQSKMTEIRNQLLKTKLSEEKIKLLIDRITMADSQGSSKLSKETSEQTRKHIEEFARMFNGKGLEKTLEKEGSRQELYHLVIDPNQRAFAYPRTGHITSNGQKQTLFHEIGHIMEAQRDWLLTYSNRWRDSRAFSLEKAYKNPDTQKLVGDGSATKVPYIMETLPSTKQTVPVFKLSDMIPLQKAGFKPTEVAVIDTFLSPYLGKKYDDGFTEIVSSTIEHFSEPYLMSHLYKNHPDLFSLGVGLALN